MTIKRLNIGDKVKVTQKSWQNADNGCRSIKHFPCWDYVEKFKKYIGQTAIVTMQFLPGYEVNITFDDEQIFQVKDNWVE